MLSQVTTGLFWDGYEPVIVLVLLLGAPVVGFVLGGLRASGDKAISPYWRRQSRRAYQKSRLPWLLAYYTALVLAVVFGSQFQIGLIFLLPCALMLLGPIVGLWLYWGGLEFTLYVYADQCWHCGYDLTGNTSGICPECGKPIPGQDAGSEV